MKIKNYLINLGKLAYVLVGENYTDFGFHFHLEKLDGENFLRLERGTHLKGSEFEEDKEFGYQLPDLDCVILLEKKPDITFNVRSAQ